MKKYKKKIETVTFLFASHLSVLGFFRRFLKNRRNRRIGARKVAKIGQATSVKHDVIFNPGNLQSGLSISL
jgi:hypothetical protein